jgi:3-deoxy-D-manno-octulosonic-acid transferase
MSATSPIRRARTAGDLLFPAIYNGGLTLLSPLIAAIAWSKLARRGTAGHWRERLGYLPAPPEGEPRVWLQSVSMGETVAAAAVASELRSLRPGLALLATTTTETGQRHAQRAMPFARTAYFPLDLWPCVRRAVTRVRPRLLVTTEEVWPNLLRAASRSGVRCAVINGKVSQRTYCRARRLRRFARWVLGGLDLILVQSKPDADRVLDLGAPPERVLVTGNVKFDQETPVLSDSERRAARAELGWDAARPVIVAGSVHPGEEQPILAAFAALRTREPRLGLLVAPRHVEKSGVWETACRERALVARRRTEGGHATPDVVILDTMGELARMYGVGEIAVIGGTFVAVGGHDPLQPLAHGLPVIVGPHTHQQRDLVGLAEEAGALRRAADGRELELILSDLLARPSCREEMRAAGQRLLATHRGAAARSARALCRLLEET